MIEGKYLYYINDLTDVLDIRRKVFHRNDNLENNLDGQLDQESIHVVAYANSLPVATGRLYSDKHQYYIDQVAVLEEEQGNGYGDFIVRMLVDKAFILGGDEVIVCSPINIKEFFIKIGFNSYDGESNKVGLEFITLKICQSDLLKKCQNKR